jgi:hypothetical protein
MWSGIEAGIVPYKYQYCQCLARSRDARESSHSRRPLIPETMNLEISIQAFL